MSCIWSVVVRKSLFLLASHVEVTQPTKGEGGVPKLTQSGKNCVLVIISKSHLKMAGRMLTQIQRPTSWQRVGPLLRSKARFHKGCWCRQKVGASKGVKSRRTNRSCKKEILGRLVGEKCLRGNPDPIQGRHRSVVRQDPMVGGLSHEPLRKSSADTLGICRGTVLIQTRILLRSRLAN